MAWVLPPDNAVECWIGVVRESDRRVVRLAGRLSVAQVPELLGACAEPSPLPIELDLTELVSADPAGIEALQGLRGRGATLVGAPGYLQLKLDTNSAAEPTGPFAKGRPKEQPTVTAGSERLLPCEPNGAAHGPPGT